ncbi:hypothetical protein ACQKLX_23130 [Bosea sp. NPDC003192]|uniref:hypothetical protein n=1 Tax=Bosea sp. NPDC003192 TaxID=3390551 RepID=UPI003D061BF5
MFRTLASAGLIAAAALGISAASPSKAEAGVLIQQAYYDGPGYGWRAPPPAYGYWGVPRWRRHYDRPRFYGPPPPPPPRYYRRWREW